MSFSTVEQIALGLCSRSWLIDRFDPLHGHCQTGRIDHSPVAELVVLAFPNELGPELG
ncbi:MAG: hypothetical protein AABM43_01955 [Actinomycetota bacterium]